jgi:hypothetical protein
MGLNSSFSGAVAPTEDARSDSVVPGLSRAAVENSIQMLSCPTATWTEVRSIHGAGRITYPDVP